MERAIDVIEQVAGDRGLLASLSDGDRQRLIIAAERIASPNRADRKRLSQARKKRERAALAEKRASDEEHLAQTGIRLQPSVRQCKKPHPPAPRVLPESLIASPVGASPENDRADNDRADNDRADNDRADNILDSDQSTSKGGDNPRRLNAARNCYICKKSYDLLHEFYDSLCPTCAELNWNKRQQTSDLSGRYALVTGGRVKIGYHVVLKLLEAGSHVLVTTRFPRDAARRFEQEPDSNQWMDRLQIHGLDLRHTPSVEAFAEHMCATLPRLDFILNNACQTVRRPPGFYSHLMENERALADSLSDSTRKMLQSYHSLRGAEGESTAHVPALPEQVDDSLAGIHRAAELSQIPLVAGDTDTSEALFPVGELDRDEQQVDLRRVNSWRLRLADVPTVELLEVQLVNAVAPFILNSRLKPLMLRVPTHDKHIVNVSAMEGVFYRAYKTDKHPHTNMAKAALNMLTRTSAQDYVRAGIHMNAVDTGWITDEDPAEIAARKTDELGFHPPLDQIDAAARICDPIFSGINSGLHSWGNFLKDYQVANW